MPKNNIFESKDYLSIVYSDLRRPRTTYPLLFAKHLKENIYGEVGSILDVGCGRGDFLDAFSQLGFSVTGTDLSPAAEENAFPHKVKTCNLETDCFPFAENQFDFLFSKSVIEHLHNPMRCLIQSQTVLKPGGKALIMTPSWIHTSWGPFYADYTHVTPFTIPSLSDAMILAGFEDVSVNYFFQLPFLWNRPWLKPLIRALSILPLPYYPMHNVKLGSGLNTLIRFSREVMLIGIGHKPN